MSALDYRLDDVTRTEVFDAIQDLFEHYDLLLTPTLAVPPFDNADDGNTVGPSEVNGEEVDPLLGWCLTYPFNFTGQPSLSLPLWQSDDGLPMGMMFTGRYGDEATLFRLAAQLEKEAPWKDRRPQVWG